VEQSKIPEIYRQENHYTISAIVFIQRIDNLAKTNNWTDAVTYANVANTLRGGEELLLSGASSKQSFVY
jgi:hypothetical protein